MWGNNFLNFKVVFTCIHIEKGDEGIIANELVKRGICSWTPLEEVAVFRGQKILDFSGYQNLVLLGQGGPYCALS